MAAALVEIVEPATTPERLLSTVEAAERLGLSRAMVYILLGDGRLRSVHAGRRRLIPQSAIDDFARDGAV